MRTLLALAVLLVASGGCTNASLAEAYGRPDPFTWSYFEEGSANDVADALVEAFQLSGVRVESVRSEDGGIVMTVSTRLGSSDHSEIRIENTSVEDFTSRAQIYPDGDPLPRWLEVEVTSRI